LRGACFRVKRDEIALGDGDDWSSEDILFPFWN
jgi:hypothetical protein